MLDLRTAAIFVSILFTIQGVVTLMFTLLARSYRGTAAWAVSNLLATLATILYGLRDIIPDFVSIVVANLLYALALCWLYYGVRQFLKMGTPPRYLVLFPLIVVVAIPYLTYVRDDIVARSILMSAVLVALMVNTALLLFTKTTPALRRSHWFTATIFLLFAGFHLVRIIPLLALPPTSPLALNLLFSIPMIVSAVCGLLWTAGIALMITERLVVELQHTATHDFLTSTLNRRAAQTLLEAEVHRAHQQESPLSILLMDVDHFKLINDHYGHATGDEVLVTLVQRMSRVSGTTTQIARWGGEEFLVILPATSANSAYETAHQVLTLIAGTPIVVEGKAIACSVSIGVATIESATTTLDDLLRRADRALYHAKHAGRNMVFADSSTVADVAA